MARLLSRKIASHPLVEWKMRELHRNASFDILASHPANTFESDNIRVWIEPAAACVLYQNIELCQSVDIA